MAKIVITGATGLIGKALCRALVAAKHEVVALSRHKTKVDACDIPVYKWDIQKAYIDKEALRHADYIIHLAGANIADKAWKPKRKKIIIDSRVESTKLLFKYVQKMNIPLKKFICSSATGYYGAVISHHTFNEDTPMGNNFLANVCLQWETAAEQFSSLGIPVCIFRNGVVLAKEGGAFPKLLAPVKCGLGAPLGSGRQYVPWIHITDLVNMYVYAIEHPLEGTYNAVSGKKGRNKIFMETLAKVWHRPFIMPRVPEILLKLWMGQRSMVITKGSKIANDKIKAAGFQFKFEQLEEALENLR